MCERTERGGNISTGHCFDSSPARHYQAASCTALTGVNNRIKCLFLFRCEYVQDSQSLYVCMCGVFFFFCIELQNSLQSWPSVKGSSSSLIHIIRANSALISHATTNHTVFSWFTGHSTFRNPPLSHSWGG